MTEKEIDQRLASLNLVYHDRNLLETALTHRSFLNEHSQVKESNERLEFLGDAVLQFLTSEYLYHKYPQSPEGYLTNLRAALVCTPSLAKTLRSIELNQFIRLSKGEEDSGGREKDYILANTFEAILGSLYLDSGLGSCRELIEKYLFTNLEDIVQSGTFKDYKSRLQELTQEKFSETPSYKEIESSGPDHDKNFVMGVILLNRVFAQGAGSSKQRAEQSAAKAAIEKIEKM